MGAIQSMSNSSVHRSVGLCDGEVDGIEDGIGVGISDGIVVGERVGLEVGNLVGCFEGSMVGKLVGTLDGPMVGINGREFCFGTVGLEVGKELVVGGGVDVNCSEQQVRNVTPSDVGQQSPVNPEQAG